MSAETITTAIFLITAVVASAVLVNAIYPVVYTAAGSFSSTTHDADTRIRTDFKIIAYVAYASNSVNDDKNTGKVWLKNIGSSTISITEFDQADVFFGPVGNFNRLAHNTTPVLSTGQWKVDPDDSNTNGWWDTGETVLITMVSLPNLIKEEPVYFQFSLPNGVYRSIEYTVSNT